MVQLAKFLLWKQKGLSLVPRSPGAHWLDSLAYYVNCWLVSDSVSRNEVDGARETTLKVDL